MCVYMDTQRITWIKIKKTKLPVGLQIEIMLAFAVIKLQNKTPTVLNVM